MRSAHRGCFGCYGELFQHLILVEGEAVVDARVTGVDRVVLDPDRLWFASAEQGVRLGVTQHDDALAHLLGLRIQRVAAAHVVALPDRTELALCAALHVRARDMVDEDVGRPERTEDFVELVDRGADVVAVVAGCPADRGDDHDLDAVGDDVGADLVSNVMERAAHALVVVAADEFDLVGVADGAEADLLLLAALVPVEHKAGVGARRAPVRG